jgi:ABC-2 type transport system ATP-binding protein
VDEVADALRGRPGVEMVAPFGSTLHVSGTDRETLMQAVAPWRSDGRLSWSEISPSLEDVFIHLMNTSRDNYA